MTLSDLQWHVLLRQLSSSSNYHAERHTRTDTQTGTSTEWITSQDNLVKTVKQDRLQTDTLSRNQYYLASSSLVVIIVRLKIWLWRYDRIFRSCVKLINSYIQWLKWGARWAQSPAPVWAPCSSMSPLAAESEPILLNVWPIFRVKRNRRMLTILLSRRSQQRERLSASVLSICLSVCLSVCLSPNAKKNAIFSKKQFRDMVSIDDL